MIRKNGILKTKKAMFLPATLIVVMLMLVLASALLTMVMANLKRSNLYSRQISATNVAEAGINYYLWHLAHNSSDYTDGHAGDTLKADGYYGPYSHDYSDTSGTTIGSYDLYIYPPDVSSTTVRVRSVGHLSGLNLTKSILTRLSMPYFSQYFLLSFSNETWIGSDETVNGPVHSNNTQAGIRNDGVTGAATATCVSQYTSTIDNAKHNCIWGTGTFTAGFQYPVNTLNVADVNYTSLKTTAGTSGNVYYPENTGPYIGYHLILKANSYDLKKVKTTTSHRGTMPDGSSQNIPDQIKAEDNYLSNQPYPANGLMFFEDNLWVEGTITNNRVSVVAAKPSETRTNFLKNIYIINNLTYNEKNSQTKVGLISQRRIVLSYVTPSNLTVDAAMLTKNDYIFFPGYDGLVKGSLNIYGSMAHQGGLIFTWVDGSNHVTSGWPTTHYDFDPDLVFSPPPYFPKSGNYQITSWQEDPNF